MEDVQRDALVNKKARFSSFQEPRISHENSERSASKILDEDTNVNFDDGAEIMPPPLIPT